MAVQRLPMFALSAVLFPGMSVPLHVFEDRYRAMVEHLLSVSNPADRLFFSVAIREGYEVGDHGVQSLYRVGCRLQLTEVSARSDGSYDVVAVVRDRVRLGTLHTQTPFPQGDIEPMADSGQGAAPELVERARRAASALYEQLAALGRPIELGPLPKDSHYLSWMLSANAPLPMAERQALLEADGPQERLALLTEHYRGELRAIAAIPSLPATDLARTRWSPN